MTTIRKDFITGEVQENPLTNGATSLTMAGALQALPTVGGGDIARLVIDPFGADVLGGSGPEIVHVTAYTTGGGSATVLRGQGGTSAKPHSQNTPIIHAPTKADWDEVFAAISAHAGTNVGVHGVGASPVASVANIAGHSSATAGVHGVGGSNVESASGSQAKVNAHSALATGVHGVGGSTVAAVDDIVQRARLTFITGAVDPPNSPPGLLDVEWLMQAGTVVQNTGVSGDMDIVLTTPFPNGLLTFVAFFGDGPPGFCNAQMVGSSKSQLRVKCSNAGGTFNSSTLRVDFIALGW